MIGFGIGLLFVMNKLYLFRLELQFCYEHFFLLVRIEIGILEMLVFLLVGILKCINYIKLEC